MNHASEVVISGSSAGGLAVLNHIDYLKHKIHTRSRTKPVVVGIVDGGYFMDIPSISGESLINQVYKNIFLQQNVTVNHKCMKFYEETQPGQGWKCMMPQYSMQFISTPIFLVQSFVDLYQVHEVMDLQCVPGSSSGKRCRKVDFEYLRRFRSRMIASIKYSLPENSGYWLVSCTLHTITNHDHSWVALTGKYRTLRDTVLGWYETYTRDRQVKKSDWTEVDSNYDDIESCHVVEIEEEMEEEEDKREDRDD